MQPSFSISCTDNIKKKEGSVNDGCRKAGLQYPSVLHIVDGDSCKNVAYILKSLYKKKGGKETSSIE